MLKREVNSISRIARDLQSHIERRLSENEFAESSSIFLKYIIEVCESIGRYIQNISSRIDMHQVDPREERILLNDLITIKKILSSFHKLVKNVAESNILVVPFPLVALVNKIIKNLSNIEDKTHVIVMSTDEYSFYHDPIMNIRSISAPHIFPDFPKELGFISFPFLEAKNILENCALFHELGHYVYYILDVKSRITTELTDLLDINKSSDSLARFLKEKVLASDIFAADRLRRKGWTIIRYWAAEIFCDFLASRLIGPAYLYNFWLLQYSLPLDEIQSFSDRHPAFLYRLSKIYTFLYSEGWSDVIKTSTPEVYKWLKEHCGIEGEEKQYNLIRELREYLETREFCEWLLKRFNDLVIPFIGEYVKEISRQTGASKDDFDKNHETIINYLKHFLVPSFLINGNGKKSIPTHSTLLTTATIFYLTSIDTWKDLIEGIKTESSLEQHALFYKKLNDFVSKAMTDLLILRR